MCKSKLSVEAISSGEEVHKFNVFLIDQISGQVYQQDASAILLLGSLFRMLVFAESAFRAFRNDELAVLYLIARSELELLANVRNAKRANYLGDVVLERHKVDLRTFKAAVKSKSSDDPNPFFGEFKDEDAIKLKITELEELIADLELKGHKRNSIYEKLNMADLHHEYEVKYQLFSARSHADSKTLEIDHMEVSGNEVCFKRTRHNEIDAAMLYSSIIEYCGLALEVAREYELVDSSVTDEYKKRYKVFYNTVMADQ